MYLLYVVLLFLSIGMQYQSHPFFPKATPQTLLTPQDMKYFHIQMTADSPWIVELGESLTHVMAYLASYDTMPYAHFTTPY